MLPAHRQVQAAFPERATPYFPLTIRIFYYKGAWMNFKLVLLVIACLSAIAAAADRYEAENAMVDSNSVQKMPDATASGGYYVNMKDGNLSFKVTVAAAGFYVLWATYSQPNDSNGKIQNLSINANPKVRCLSLIHNHLPQSKLPPKSSWRQVSTRLTSSSPGDG